VEYFQFNSNNINFTVHLKCISEKYGVVAYGLKSVAQSLNAKYCRPQIFQLLLLHTRQKIVDLDITVWPLTS